MVVDLVIESIPATSQWCAQILTSYIIYCTYRQLFFSPIVYFQTLAAEMERHVSYLLINSLQKEIEHMCTKKSYLSWRKKVLHQKNRNKCRGIVRKQDPIK